MSHGLWITWHGSFIWENSLTLQKESSDPVLIFPETFTFSEIMSLGSWSTWHNSFIWRTWLIHFRHAHSYETSIVFYVLTLCPSCFLCSLFVLRAFHPRSFFFFSITGYLHAFIWDMLIHMRHRWFSIYSLFVLRAFSPPTIFLFFSLAGYLQHDYRTQVDEKNDVTHINSKPFDPRRVYVVALPRNLLAGFCSIKPLTVMRVCGWHESWLIYMGDMCQNLFTRGTGVMTHLYEWIDLFMCDMTHSCVWHEWFMCVTIWLIRTCGMTHSCVWHDSFVCVWRDSLIWVAWLIHMCCMTYSYVWYDSFICVTWRIHMCGMTHAYVLHDSFICVTWHIHICDMTHPYVWRDSFIFVIWLIPMCGITHSYMWHDLYICVTWLIHMCDMTRSCMWHDSFIMSPWRSSVGVWHGSWLVYMYDMALLYVTWLIYHCDATHSYVWHDSLIRVTWLIHMCDMTHSTVIRACATWVMLHVWRSHVTPMNDWFICDMTLSCVKRLIHSRHTVKWLIHSWHSFTHEFHFMTYI